MIKIGIHGSTGKMGQEIISSLVEYPGLKLVYCYARNGKKLSELCELSDLVLDFTSPEGTMALLAEALKCNTKLVIGTTGFSPEQTSEIMKASEKIAILCAPNMSFGVVLLNILATKAATILHDYDVDIMDKHHAGKKDAPSGTALMLGKNIARARGVEFVAHNYLEGLRPEGSIGYSAIRAGNLPAENHVMLTGQDDSLTLTHKAQSRQVFAKGAIKAALWLSKQGVGFYNMENALGYLQSL